MATIFLMTLLVPVVLWVTVRLESSLDRRDSAADEELPSRLAADIERPLEFAQGAGDPGAAAASASARERPS